VEDADCVIYFDGVAMPRGTQARKLLRDTGGQVQQVVGEVLMSSVDVPGYLSTNKDLQVTNEAETFRLKIISRLVSCRSMYRVLKNSVGYSTFGCTSLQSQRALTIK
jgi:hypothetical protein